MEDGPRTLTVCEGCSTDAALGKYGDLQQALNAAMAGDTVAVSAGTYTGNFIAYKDVTVQHAGLDIAGLIGPGRLTCARSCRLRR